MKNAATIKSVAQDWLSFQCRLLQGVSHAMVLLDEAGRQQFAPAATWTDGATRDGATLTETARIALTSRQPVIGELNPGGLPQPGRRDVAAMPLLLDGQLLGAVAFEMQRPADVQQRAVLSMLQLGVAWLEFLLRQHDSQRLEHLERTLAAVASALQSDTLPGAATAMVTTLATDLDCERVSLGLRGRRHCRVIALSHSARFEKRANLIRDIESAMDEALEQDMALAHPPIHGDIPAITLAQRELGTQHGGNAVLTVPLVMQGRLIGGLTLERTADRPFDPDEATRLREMAEVIAPLIEARRIATQSLPARAGSSIAALAKKLGGRGHHHFKIASAVVAAALLWLCTATTTYQVAATASLEGTVQRVVVAPRDGFIGSASASAGDTVAANQSLATLDDRDLQLELQKWESERDQYRQKHRETLAKRDLGGAAVLDAQIGEAEAQIALVRDQLARGQLLAPFEGVVVKGDLKHSLGAPVKRGDVLFELAPLDGYRVIVEVEEAAIADVKPGQLGHILLTALPDQPIAFVVEKVTPVATAAEGRNSFRVEAHLEAPPANLRPGMRGVAKIDVEPRTRLWIWTHRLVDWLRVRTWSWWPA